MNSTYFKATIREITYSWGKFISIVLIILLGSLLYVGIRATGPDLDNSADRYFAQQNLGDLNVTSTLGLTNKDLKLVKSDDNVQTAEASHMVTIKKSQNQVVQVYSYSKAAKLNKLKVVSGHLPTKNNQIVLDAKAKSDGYRLGQTYTLPKTDGLKSKSFKIVGFVNSPLFVSSTDRGTTNVGSGEVDYFAYTPEQSFDQKAFATIAVRFDNTADLTAGTSAYNQRVNRDQEQLESKLKARPTQRRTELTGTALSKINRQLARLQKQAKQLQAVPAQYQSATTKAAAKKLTAGISKLQAAQKKLQQTPQATYMYNDRTANVGYQAGLL
ncbi:MAG: hypothetical protein SOH70_02400 [Lentilactobacillus sunkii]|uniref:hypothetical protein n=1 Tax=Lentilactobacillus sunkii TaxID=481719 RepID=UPI002F351EB5